MYDYLIVGTGLFGSVFAYEAKKRGKTSLVVERRCHIGGNCYTEEVEGINVHKYGAHIFHTSDKLIWEYIQQFCEMNNYINSPIANYNGEIFNLPFNMNTFSKMWNISTPQEAKKIINSQRKLQNDNSQNLEAHIIGMVGTDIYEKLVKGYTEKQWGKPCNELPSSIIKRLPVRFTYDNNYFNDIYQGIPKGGYIKIFEKLLEGIEVIFNTDFNANKEYFASKAKKVIYTGTIDSYYDYCYGELEYRSIKLENETYDVENYQGVAVMNFTDKDTPYTRIIEHKHFEFGTQPKTVISKEYPIAWTTEQEPYYPINDDKNNALYNKYKELSSKDDKIIFGGRLGEYKYYDMDKVISSSLNLIMDIV